MRHKKNSVIIFVFNFESYSNLNCTWCRVWGVSLPPWRRVCGGLSWGLLRGPRARRVSALPPWLRLLWRTKRQRMWRLHRPGLHPAQRRMSDALPPLHLQGVSDRRMPRYKRKLGNIFCYCSQSALDLQDWSNKTQLKKKHN